MLRTFIISAVLIFGILVGIISQRISPIAPNVSVLHPIQIDISYQDFIIVFLTLIAVLLTALTIIIAILSVIGWQNINGKVHNVAREEINKALKPGNKLHDDIMDKVSGIAYLGIGRIDLEYEDNIHREVENNDK